MREELDRRQVHQASDGALSGLTGDPWLYSKVSAAAGKGETKVKRKISLGLVLAIVLALLATAALAAVLLSHQEIMEQVAVPLANENDGPTGVNRSYTPEQLAELIRAASSGLPWSLPASASVTEVEADDADNYLDDIDDEKEEIEG